jgi:hypothetical protein
LASLFGFFGLVRESEAVTRMLYLFITTLIFNEITAEIIGQCAESGAVFLSIGIGILIMYGLRILASRDHYFGMVSSWVSIINRATIILLFSLDCSLLACNTILVQA